MLSEIQDLETVFWNTEKAFKRVLLFPPFCPLPFSKVFWKLIILEKTQSYDTKMQTKLYWISKQNPSITHLKPEQNETTGT